MTDDRPPKPRRRTLAKTRPTAPRKRTTLIAAVPTAGGSPRRCYDIGDETDEEIAAMIMADLRSDDAGKEAGVPTPTESAADPSPTSTA